jgi:hypothetical protein
VQQFQRRHGASTFRKRPKTSLQEGESVIHEAVWTLCAQPAMILGKSEDELMSASNSSTGIDLHIDMEVKRIVGDDNRTRLPKEQWEAFLAKLDDPPKDLPQLRQLMREPSIFVKE